jgi:hypothetical protein
MLCDLDGQDGTEQEHARENRHILRFVVCRLSLCLCLCLCLRGCERLCVVAHRYIRSTAGTSRPRLSARLPSRGVVRSEEEEEKHQKHGSRCPRGGEAEGAEGRRITFLSTASLHGMAWHGVVDQRRMRGLLARRLVQSCKRV